MKPVKKIDENAVGALDHVGWLLWSAARTWKTRFVAEMVAAGHGWFDEARADVLGHVNPKGVRQSRIVERMGLSKQAVQQHLDALEADGILTRQPDPDDARHRIVLFTAAGRAVLEDADRIKLIIEAEYRDRLGAARFAALFDGLKAIA